MPTPLRFLIFPHDGVRNGPGYLSICSAAGGSIDSRHRVSRVVPAPNGMCYNRRGGGYTVPDADGRRGNMTPKVPFQENTSILRPLTARSRNMILNEQLSQNHAMFRGRWPQNVSIPNNGATMTQRIQGISLRPPATTTQRIQVISLRHPANTTQRIQGIALRPPATMTQRIQGGSLRPPTVDLQSNSISRRERFKKMKMTERRIPDFENPRHKPQTMKNSSVQQMVSQKEVMRKNTSERRPKSWVESNEMASRKPKFENKHFKPFKDEFDFEWYFKELTSFKNVNGHCDVGTDAALSSLRNWCVRIRCALDRIRNNKFSGVKLSEDQIQRLDKIGFDWSKRSHTLFEERFEELATFHAQFGHSDITAHQAGDSYHYLGRWCSEMRVAYKKIQNNEKSKTKLSQEQISLLNGIGFKWSLADQRCKIVFEKRLMELRDFKAHYGHCDVSATRGDHISLGRWSNRIRTAYKRIANRSQHDAKLSDEQIRILEDMGFKWHYKQQRTQNEDRVEYKTLLQEYVKSHYKAA